MLSAGDLVLPYGIADREIGIALIELDELVGAMESD
jgi:hypothetical protein